MKKRKPRKIKLLLVDDHPIVLEGIKWRLSAQEDLEVVGEAADGNGLHYFTVIFVQK